MDEKTVGPDERPRISEPHEPHEALTSITGAKPHVTGAKKFVVYGVIVVIATIIALAASHVLDRPHGNAKKNGGKDQQQSEGQDVKPQYPGFLAAQMAIRKFRPVQGAPSSAQRALPGIPAKNDAPVGSRLFGLIPPPSSITPQAAQSAAAAAQNLPGGGGERENVSGRSNAVESEREKILQARSASHVSPLLVGLGGSGTGAKPAGSSGQGASSAAAATAKPDDKNDEPWQHDQNWQSEKINFLNTKRDSSSYLSGALEAPLSRFEVKAGSVIPVVTISGMNSDLPGNIVAQVRENVYDTVSGRHLLIPQGARVVGTYGSVISYGQDGLLVVWSRLILPNGYSLNLENMPGVDLSGYAGYRDKVNNHYGKVLFTAMLSSVLTTGTYFISGGQQQYGLMINPPNYTVGQAAGQAAANSINAVGNKIIERSLNVQPTIEIRMGKRFNIFVHKDMILRPYHGS